MMANVLSIERMGINRVIIDYRYFFLMWYHKYALLQSVDSGIILPFGTISVR
jgi:hypothetical protein